MRYRKKYFDGYEIEREATIIPVAVTSFFANRMKLSEIPCSFLRDMAVRGSDGVLCRKELTYRQHNNIHVEG